MTTNTRAAFVAGNGLSKASITMMTLALSLAIVVGCDDKKQSAMAPRPVDVGVLTIAPQTVPVSYEFVGVTAASKTVEIRARVQGFLDKRLFEEGGKVAEGDTLFQIDPRSYQADLEVASARLAQAQARAAQTKRDEARYKVLLAQNAAQQKEYDDALTQLQDAEASVRLAQASLAKAQLDLSYTTIASPLTGKIGKSLREVGSLVDPGTNSLLTNVVSIDPLYVSFNIGERDYLGWVDDVREKRILLPAEGTLQIAITLINGTPYPHLGKLNFADSQMNPATGSYEVRAAVANPDQKLLPGQFVKARIVGWQRPDTIVVPLRAVQQNPTGSFVFVVGEGDKAELRGVKLGQWQGVDGWIITQGLKTGDRVIIDGTVAVRPGVALKIAEPKTVAAGEASAKAPAQVASTQPKDGGSGFPDVPGAR